MQANVPKKLRLVCAISAQTLIIVNDDPDPAKSYTAGYILAGDDTKCSVSQAVVNAKLFVNSPRLFELCVHVKHLLTQELSKELDEIIADIFEK